MIKTKGLTKSFGALKALDNLTLEIGPGEVFGFIGPNGAGKSTTMKLLACLIRPDAGTASVCGHSIAGDADTPSAPGHGHVLLVDDEAAFQRLVAAFLRSLGHEVTLAGDGDQAQAAFAQRRPELVLLDLAMPPHMDPEIGLELINRKSVV